MSRSQIRNEVTGDPPQGCVQQARYYKAINNVGGGGIYPSSVSNFVQYFIKLEGKKLLLQESAVLDCVPVNLEGLCAYSR